jgi:hypothetical protein
MMELEHVVKKCVQCQREHNAPASICFICMEETIRGTVPKRVGIAKRGEVVILECLEMHSQEDTCRISNTLGDMSKETGIRFLVLNPSIKLARIGARLTREQAVELARNYAYAKPQSYVTGFKREEWMPHEWVIDAILAAANGENDESPCVA